MIVIDEEQIEARVLDYKLTKSGEVMYIVNIDLPDIGLFIKRATVQKSKVSGMNWWLQPPRYFSGKKWQSPLEANTHLPLWQAIEKKVFEILDVYVAENYIPTDKELEEPINLDDIDFDPPKNKARPP